MDGNLRGRNTAMHRVVDRIERFVEDETGLEDSRELIVGVGALLLASIFMELRELKRSVTTVITGRQHYSDPKEMYNALIEKAGELTEPDHFKVDVLGLTLYSAWPELQELVREGDAQRAGIRTCSLSFRAGSLARGRG